MDFRKTVAVVLLLGFAGLVLAAPAQANILDGETAGPQEREMGFLARVLDWIEALFSEVASDFSASEGSAITSNG